MSVAEMAVSLYAIDRGYMDDVDMNQIGAFEAALIDHMNNTKGDFMKSLNESGDFNEEVEAQLKAGVEDFKKTGSY